MGDAMLDMARLSYDSNEPCIIVAEAGVNHNGDVLRALEMVDVAADAGVDAIKFQSFRAKDIVTVDAPKAQYQLRSTEAGESQFEMLRRLELSDGAHRELRRYCAARNIAFVSTPFDVGSADLLQSLEVPFYKISSGDLTNMPLLVHVAAKGRPVVLSTGMANLDEVADAVRVVREAGNPNVVLLHCVSNYPADPLDVNLRAMKTLAETFGLPVGLSDHTVGLEVSIAARALGACFLERHFTLDRTLPGPDHAASLERAELVNLVKGIRNVEAALGTGNKVPVPSEGDTARVARKSLVARQDLEAGEVLTREHIAVLRPGTGLPPAMLERVLGRSVNVAIRAGTLLTWEMLS
jgi:N,N'-diacetyllegionaminate synthase